MRDPLGNVTTYTYDALGQMTSSTTPLGSVTGYVYDEMGRQTAVTDPLSHTTTYLYDAKGQMVGIVNKDGTSVSAVYAYDGNGNLVSKTDADGYTTEYTYNSIDLVTNINYNNAKEVSYRYNATGDLVSMTDWLGTSTFELDLLHRITAATDHKGNRVEYDYDGMGNQIEIRYPDGTSAAMSLTLCRWYSISTSRTMPSTGSTQLG